jgi:membrane complex biogenesis BtpA family protein
MSEVRPILTSAERPSVIGMVHVGALPGTPYNTQELQSIVHHAVAEAEVLEAGGLDAVMIENMHDRPYLRSQVGPEIVAGMTAVGVAVRQAVSIPLGVQILAGANRQALAVAQACGASFVRVEGFVYAHVADEGLIAQADAGDLLRYRRAIGAQDVAVWADVKKKHSSHAITADVDLAETARTAEFFGADAVVITGTATGQPTAPQDVSVARQAVRVPIAVGSGITAENLAQYWASADAFIVGSSLKRDGVWSNPCEPARVRRLVEVARALRR